MCSNLGILSPTYTTYSRDGCWFCHNQGLEQLRNLRKMHPEKWLQMLKWDSESPVSFRPECTIHDLEIRFSLEDEWTKFGMNTKSKEFFKEYRCRKERFTNEII